MICTCGKKINPKRVELGYSTCITCSEEKMNGVIDIVYHKTGNTIQVVDIETQKEVDKLSRRSGFGIMSGMRQSKSNTYNPKNIKNGASTSIIGSPESYEEVGSTMMDRLELLGRDSALKYIEDSRKYLRINTSQYYSLKKIIDALSPAENLPKKSNKVQEKIDDDIQWMFRNWK